jgi:alpha-glucosidase
MRRLILKPPLEARLGLLHDDTLVDPPHPQPGEAVSFSLWVRKDAGVTAAQLRTAPDGEEALWPLHPVEERGDHVRFSGRFHPHVRRLRYRFRLERPDGVLHYGMAGVSTIDPIDNFDFTLHLGPPLPDWPLDAVLYQIFPDRFDDGDPTNNVKDGEWHLRGKPTVARPFGEKPLPWSEAGNLDFYGGDLQGIERRLGHLERLGVTALFLNPIWSALSNHRYDYIDHAAVDPHLGGDAALAALATALRVRDMRLVLDVILNHTGSGHPWFNREGLFGAGGAYHDPASPHRNFYFFEGAGPRASYRSWLGFDTLPRLNFATPGVRAAFFAAPEGCLRKYLRPPFSVDGYRFDVANMLGRDGALQEHRPLWNAVRGSLREERADAWLMGEHFFDPDKLLKGDGLDGVMAYHAFTFPVRTFLARRDRRGTPSALDAGELVRLWQRAWARVGFGAWRRSSLHVNSHDISRLQTVTGERRHLDLGSALALTLPGVPCIYYGDEIGLEGGADPDNRRCMIWDEDAWDRQRLAHLTEAVWRRRRSPALRRGGFVDLGSNGDVLAFARPLGDEVKLVVASRADEPLVVQVATGGVPGARKKRVEVELPPLGLRVVDIGSAS